MVYLDRFTTFSMSIPEIKVSFLGDLGVGKTSLFHRFMKDEFMVDGSTSLKIDIGRKDFQFSSKKVCFAFQDTKGFESLGSFIPTSIFRSVECVIFVYDLSDLDSLNALQDWKNNFDVYEQKYISILVGNKLDLVGEPNTGDDLDRTKRAIKPEMDFQVSAKTGVGCDKILQFLVETFHKRGCDTFNQSISLNNTPVTVRPVQICCSIS